MKKSLYFIQMIAVLSIILLISLFSKRSLMFVMEYESIILIFLYLLIPTIFVYGIKKSLSFFSTPFKESSTEKEKKEAIKFFKGMTVYSLYSSIAVSLSVICFMLGNLEEPNSLGPFLAVALITPLYSILLSLSVFMPLRFYLEKELED